MIRTGNDKRGLGYNEFGANEKPRLDSQRTVKSFEKDLEIFLSKKYFSGSQKTVFMKYSATFLKNSVKIKQNYSIYNFYGTQEKLCHQNENFIKNTVKNIKKDVSFKNLKNLKALAFIRKIARNCRKKKYAKIPWRYLYLEKPVSLIKSF